MIKCMHSVTARLNLLVRLTLRAYTVDGWDVYKERVQLNGLSTVAGWPTPDDDDVPPNCSCPLDDCLLIEATWVYDTTIESEEPPPTGSGTYIEFFSEGDLSPVPVNYHYGIVHGPYMVSKDALKITAGSTLSFDWYASADLDDFDVFAYLVDVSEINSCEQPTMHGGGSAMIATTPK